MRSLIRSVAGARTCSTLLARPAQNAALAVTRRGIASAAGPPSRRRNREPAAQDDEFDPEEEEESTDAYELGEMTSDAHAELDRHREIRHFARVAAYEMPILSQLAKPFVPPTAATPLRFRYTTYLGEEHPAESKVVVEFSVADLGLNEVQASKLVKLAGVRYNPEKNTIKMSCEKFDEQAQNKRYLSDVVDKLIKTAKDGRDNFKDIPFDFRHYKPKPKKTAQLPFEWLEFSQQKMREREQKSRSEAEKISQE
ncbi:mitochondrial ribosomal subunit protein-domain-containing protein [Pyronema omphalodes]|nr:mitochondrial ribosomal subunit protein-domain-containing protein [Pyronema omphalodes]